MQTKKSLTWIWILLLVAGLSAFAWFVVIPWWNKDKESPKDGGSKPPTSGGSSGGGGGSGNTSGGGGGSSKSAIKIKDLNWNAELQSLPKTFSQEGLVTQAILRYKGFKGKDGKQLTLDGKVGPNTKFAIENYFLPIQLDQQDLSDLANSAGADTNLILLNQKQNIEAGTKGKYTV